jgi:peptidyl-prolyl cis-trans isomerase A (cyclophilin A)
MRRFAFVGLVLTAACQAEAPRPEAPAPNPADTPFTLAEALDGLGGSGPLAARIETNHGVMIVKLFEAEAPKTVANFAGLARGRRPWQDPKSGEWVKRPFYDGLTFHRVIPDFMIQGGCPLGNGTGTPGYRFADEIQPALKHDRPGILSMANAGKDTNGSQFFITERPVPNLDGKHAVFGELVEGLEVLKAIARVQRGANDKPMEPVVIRSVTIQRGT